MTNIKDYTEYQYLISLSYVYKKLFGMEIITLHIKSIQFETISKNQDICEHNEIYETIHKTVYI